jgi:hypothetical protein
MTPRDKAKLLVSLSGLVATLSVLVASTMGFAYWWPSFWVVGVASIAGALWIDTGSLAKAFAIVMLLGIACIGWALPMSNSAAPWNGFSIAPFFWGAGVTLWRIAPIGIAIAIAKPRDSRRRGSRG